MGLFSSHAKELQKAYRHLVRETLREGHTHSAARTRRRSQPRISEEVGYQIVKGYESGKTVYELAAAHGCHRATISAVLKRNGVTVRRTSPTPEEMSEMVSLYRSGLSLAKVGDQLGVHATTVLAQLRKVGVDTRTSHGDARV